MLMLAKPVEPQLAAARLSYRLREGRRSRREPSCAAWIQGRLLAIPALRHDHCVGGRRAQVERSPGGDGDRRWRAGFETDVALSLSGKGLLAPSFPKDRHNRSPGMNLNSDFSARAAVHAARLDW